MSMDLWHYQAKFTTWPYQFFFRSDGVADSHSKPIANWNQNQSPVIQRDGVTFQSGGYENTFSHSLMDTRQIDAIILMKTDTLLLFINWWLKIQQECVNWVWVIRNGLKMCIVYLCSAFCRAQVILPYVLYTWGEGRKNERMLYCYHVDILFVTVLLRKLIVRLDGMLSRISRPFPVLKSCFTSIDIPFGVKM